MAVQRKYPVLSFTPMLIVNVTAQPHDLKVLGAEGARELRPGVVRSAADILESPVQICTRTRDEETMPHIRFRRNQQSIPKRTRNKVIHRSESYRFLPEKLLDASSTMMRSGSTADLPWILRRQTA